MRKGISHKVSFLHGVAIRLLVGLCLLCAFTSSVSAQSSRSALKMNPNAYTGKAAWWLNYQYFPELTIFGQSEDTIPDIVHRLCVYANGGYAGFRFGESQATSDRKFGLGLGFQYNYFCSPFFGFRTGLGFNYAASSAQMGAFKDEFLKVDQEADAVRYKYSLSSVTEDYDIFLLEVPAQFVITHKRIMGGVGLKLAFPVSVGYEQTVTDVHTKAYFPQYDVWVDDSWVMACGDYPVLTSKDKFVAAPIVFLMSADLEYMIPVKGRKYALGIGAYIDYSINKSFSFRKGQCPNNNTDQSSMVGTTDEAPVFLQTNSMLSGLMNKESEPVVARIKYMNAGVKLSFIINSYGPPKPRTKPY